AGSRRTYSVTTPKFYRDVRAYGVTSGTLRVRFAQRSKTIRKMDAQSASVLETLLFELVLPGVALNAKRSQTKIR
ncbi:MAG TPA: hypothetical protein VK638_20025, partial [Edaphobacter sp.]|nr:hypothetical protein [Edaphobacter sp.]